MACSWLSAGTRLSLVSSHSLSQNLLHAMLRRRTVLRNPVYFIFLVLVGIGAYVTYTLNLWGPMYQMANAASAQALEEGKKRLREFLEESNAGRQAMAMSGQEDIPMRKLNGNGKVEDEDEEI